MNPAAFVLLYRKLSYADDTRRKFPNYQVRQYIVYICANRWWKCWEV
ncbi:MULTISPECIES: hypothetical protein [Parabacteroides]|nr:MULTISPECIES: hypothetical protein [Parabacteroides]MCM0715221.1 hypothetical protein [Parabacteroides sp. TA-V-105]